MNTISSIDELQRGLDHELRVLIPDTPSIYEYEKRLNDLLDEHRGVSKGLQGSLTKHHRIVAAIQARLNSFVPKVNSLLPPEILVEIFLTLSLICVNRREYYQWIAAAHVCRYWRDIILSCPQLFAHIWLPTYDHRHLQEFIRLSTTIPLDLHITGERGDAKKYQHSWEVILPHLPRTQHLHMDVEPDTFDAWPHCPLMTSLTWESQCQDPIPPEAARRVLASMPNLRILNSDTVTLGITWFSMPLASTLTTLRIDHDGGDGRPSSLEDLGAILSSLTSLTSLALENFSEWYYTLAKSSRVSCPRLPYLQQLRLSGSDIGMVNILKLPFRSKAVDIELNIENRVHEDGDPLISLPPTLTDILQNGPYGILRREIRTLYLCLQHVENFNERLVQIQGWEDENIVVQVDEDPPTFSLFFAYCPMETQTAHFFQVYGALLDRFHPLISGARVLILNERLDASGVDDFAYTAEHEMAQRLGLVKLLSLASGNNPTFLPHLQELRIGFLDEASGFADASLKTLIGPLSARRDRGHILEILVIDSTQSRETDGLVGEETVQELSTIVGRVELQSRNVR